ncbi:MAG: carboxypeptidase regulatory-like domain-containing protein [Planctomycetaceae bacterium]|nr:MAG: carboxypeptidase regulatory-like domain-containing protein [Planctomycetaceae bacterium]
MKSKITLRGILVALATVSMMLPTSGFAMEPIAEHASPSISIIDVALSEDGSLRGQVLDLQGTPMTQTTVAVVQQGNVLATTQTDAQGRYTFNEMNTGFYQVVTDQGLTVCRVWTAETAPPSALAETLVVDGLQTVRGGMNGRPWGSFLSNPWVLGGIVAAAIAIPLALDKKSSS